MAIFTAIGAAIFGAGTFGALATAAALEVATGIAVSLIGKSLSGDQQTKKQDFGIQGTIQAAGDLSRSILMGYTATAGSLVYANEWGTVDGTPNAYFTQVICVSDFPVNSLQQVWVDGELCTLDGTPHASYGYPVLEYRKGGADYLWIKFYDGTQTTADTFLTGTVASTDRPYGSTRVGKGCAYIIATSLVEESLFNGFPSFKFALNGAKLYDVSKDTTAGGSGTHDWADPSTWGGDGDFLPAVQIYNILRGFTYNSDWLYGLQGVTAARLPNADWIDAVNACRATITGPDGSEATYRSGGEVRVNSTIADTIESILTTCQGRIAEVGGVYKLHVGAPGSSVYSFTDGVIISTEEQSFTPFFGLADTVNGISASYPSPADAWNSKVAPPLLNTDYETLDGGRRLMATVSLDFVPYDGQVQRLMKSALAEARRARRHTFVLPPEAFILEPGDVIDWTSTRNGYTSKLFRVDGISDRANLDVMVDLTEVDPTDYDWNQATDYTAPGVGSAIRVRPTAQPMTGWSVNPYIYPDSAGTDRRIGFIVTFAGGLQDIRAVRIQVREDFGDNNVVWDSGEQTYDPTEADPVSRIITWAGIVPNTDYEVRGKFVAASGRDTTWSDWIAVTSPDVPDVTDLQVSQLGTELANAYGLVTDPSTGGSIPAQILALQQLAEQLGEAVATVSDTVRQRLDILAVQHGGNAAAIIQNQQAILTEAEARATAITEVVAQFGDSLADGYIKLDAVANTTTGDVSISAKVKAAVGTAVSQAAWILKATVTEDGDDALFAVLGKLHVVVPGGDGTLIPAIETLDDGTVKFSGTRMGRITSLDGLSYIDFPAGGGIDIYSQST